MDIQDFNSLTKKEQVDFINSLSKYTYVINNRVPQPSSVKVNEHQLAPGRLLCVKRLKRTDGNSQCFLLCLCDCGKWCIVNTSRFKSGRAKSCGCTKQKGLQQRKKNLVGCTFATGTKILETTEERTSNGNIVYKAKCGQCGSIYTVSTQDWRTQGHALCLECSINNNSSLGELSVQNLLLNNDIYFIREYHFEELKNRRFDFYLPDLNICIEFDGKQHFEPVEKFGGEEGFHKTVIGDREKNEFCQRKGIKLYRIPYKELRNMPNWNI